MAYNEYEKIVYQIDKLLKAEKIYPEYVESMLGGKNDFKISQVYTKKNYSNDWIDTIEDCIVSLDNIVRNPRKFIVIEEDIVDISLARSISVESIKHLSQHTNLISSVNEDGMVIPSKILNTSKEESFDIYENRFIYTLLLKLRDFIEKRFQIMQKAMLDSGEIGIQIESDFKLNGENAVKYKLDTSANFPFNSVINRSTSATRPSDMERITHIKSIVSDFLASPFAKEMRSCALVRPPITRTNVILKNPDFKKALVLWQFVETSEKMTFDIETLHETAELPDNLTEKYRGIIFLNTVLLQSIASTRDGGDTVQESKKKEQIIADMYVTRNIDDFVPDDFPLLHMDLNEIRYIYKNLTEDDKGLTPAEIAKLDGALDRVIRQQQINTAKEDSERQKKLIEEQIKAQQEAKRLALKEQKELERKAKQEEARRRILLREQEEEHKEKLAELERLAKEEAERKEAELKAQLERMENERRVEYDRMESERKTLEEDLANEARRVAELRRIQDERQANENRLKTEALEKEIALNAEYDDKLRNATIALENAKKTYNDAIAAFEKEEKALESERRAHVNKMAEMDSQIVANEEKARSTQRLIQAKDDSIKDIEHEQVLTLDRMRKKSAQYWKDQQALATKAQIDLKVGEIKSYEDTQRQRINKRHESSIKFMELAEQYFKTQAQFEDLQSLDALIQITQNHLTEEEMLTIVHEFDRKRRLRNAQWFKLQFNKFKKLLTPKTKDDSLGDDDNDNDK